MPIAIDADGLWPWLCLVYDYIYDIAAACWGLDRNFCRRKLCKLLFDTLIGGQAGVVLGRRVTSSLLHKLC